MCGITNLPELCSVSVSKRPVYGKTTIKYSDPIFVYVKNYCHWSKKACHKLHLSKDVSIVDVINKEFVSYNTQTDEFKQECTHVPQCLLDAFTEGDTVPQIFIYTNEQWEYVGDCDTLMQIEIQAAPLNLMLTNGYSSGCSIGRIRPAVALKL